MRFITCVFMLFLCGLLAGCNMPASRAGLAQLAHAKQQYDKKEFVLATHTLNGFLGREASSREAAQAYYLRGLCYRQIGPHKANLAVEDFQRTISRRGNPLLRALAHSGLGHIYYETQPNNPDKAIEHYLSALKGLKKEPPTDAVLYRLAVAQQKKGDWPQADLHLSRCFTEFETSEFAPYARDRFGCRSWSLQTGAFGDMDRAIKLTEHLRQMGWKAGWLTRKKDKQLLYVVRSGEYHTYTQAAKALIKMRPTVPDAMVVPARPKQLSR